MARYLIKIDYDHPSIIHYEDFHGYPIEYSKIWKEHLGTNFEGREVTASSKEEALSLFKADPKAYGSECNPGRTIGSDFLMAICLDFDHTEPGPKEKEFDGMWCSKCKEPVPMVEANQPDGTFICRQCRINPYR
jgi:hypothetical protein